MNHNELQKLLMALFALEFPFNNEHCFTYFSECEAKGLINPNEAYWLRKAFYYCDINLDGHSVLWIHGQDSIGSYVSLRLEDTSLCFDSLHADS
jgi:hypothetical protein